MHCSDRKSEIEQSGSDNESRIREIVREMEVETEFRKKITFGYFAIFF